MPDQLPEELQQGDPILRSPEFRENFNLIIAWIKHLSTRTSAGEGRPTGTVPPKNLPPDLIYVRNSTGADLDRFSVVAIGDPINDPVDEADRFQGPVRFHGNTPSSEADRVAILFDPIKGGEIGRAWVDGVCQVKINVEDNDDYKFALPIEGDTSALQASKYGLIPILYLHDSSADGDGANRWAFVHLSGAAGAGDVFPAKITETEPAMVFVEIDPTSQDLIEGGRTGTLIAPHRGKTPVDTYVIVNQLGPSTDPVYWADLGAGLVQNPKDLTPSGTATINDLDWSPDEDAPTYAGFDCQIVTNLYYDSGTGTLTMLARPFSGDANGNIQSLSGETSDAFEFLTTDRLVAVSPNDTTPATLMEKLVAGAGITITENNDGTNETVTIASSGTDVLVKVSDDDTTAGYLGGKIIGDDWVIATADEADPGPPIAPVDEKLRLSHGPPASGGTTYDTVVSVSQTNDGSNEVLRVTCKTYQLDSKGHVYQVAETYKDLTLVSDEFLTDLQLSGTALQYKKREIWGLKLGTESGWTTWTTGTECA